MLLIRNWWCFWERVVPALSPARAQRGQARDGGSSSLGGTQPCPLPMLSTEVRTSWGGVVKLGSLVIYVSLVLQKGFPPETQAVESPLSHCSGFM